MVSKAIHIDETLSEDVRKFARQHDILEFVEKAMKAARDNFPDAQNVSSNLKRDPEFGDLYVDVHVVLDADEEPETEADKYSECIGKWVSFLPPQVDKIRLSTSWKAR